EFLKAAEAAHAAGAPAGFAAMYVTGAGTASTTPPSISAHHGEAGNRILARRLHLAMLRFQPVAVAVDGDSLTPEVSEILSRHPHIRSGRAGTGAEAAAWIAEAAGVPHAGRA